MNAIEKVSALRRLMKKHGVDAYLIPSSDPHQDEYVPKLWQRRRFLTGFTGSAGEAVITHKHAGLWTDSRYFIQAEQQLDGKVFSLFKSGLPKVPSINDWLARELKTGQVLGLDPAVVTHNRFEDMKKFLERKEISVKCIQENLVDLIWENRPDSPGEPIRIHDKSYAGESTQSKLERVRQKMAEEPAGGLVLTKLDSIAWLFNFRGSDISYNPVVIAYAIIEPDRAAVFCDPAKVSNSLETALDGVVSFRPYPEMEQVLRRISRQNKTIWVDGDTASQHIVDIIGNTNKILFKPDPVVPLKAVKNKIEIQGMRNAHVRDGAAVVRFLAWLDRTLGKAEITELSAAAKLKAFRAKNALFQGLSFETISSYAEHGAIVHYGPTPESDARLKPESIYLVDSGGQYLDGTTDITRTIALGPPSAEQKDRFTRVLKGLISLSSTSFPKGTAGKQLDTIARLALWDKGLNYLHGTGHGIGLYLNVHEGPQAISYYHCKGFALEPGMIQSIEPGYYKEGAFGMRVENATLVVSDENWSSDGSEFYTFETLSMCPIDRKLIQKDMLRQREIDWLNRYHAKVYETLVPLLDEADKQWLYKATRPI